MSLVVACTSMREELKTRGGRQTRPYTRHHSHSQVGLQNSDMRLHCVSLVVEASRVSGDQSSSILQVHSHRLCLPSRATVAPPAPSYVLRAPFGAASRRSCCDAPHHVPRLTSS